MAKYRVQVRLLLGLKLVGIEGQQGTGKSSSQTTTRVETDVEISLAHVLDPVQVRLLLGLKHLRGYEALAGPLAFKSDYY